MSSGERDSRIEFEKWVEELKKEYNKLLPIEDTYTFMDYILFRMYDAGIPSKYLS